jgi:phage terminase large subunit
MKEDNAILIKSTYLDNIYLSEDIKKEIANLINVDENYYKIYALGERPIPNTRIYTHFRQIELMPPVDDWCYGIDFGYNHPTCLLKISWSDGNVYVKEELYKSNLTSQDIIKEMNNLGIDKKKYCFADYARPEIIEDLRRAGYNMKEAVKDVKEGIMSVKMNKIFVDKTSLNVWKEFKMYSWKTNKEQILDEPVKLYDDAMDALRYAIYTTEKRGRYDKKYVGFF